MPKRTTRLVAASPVYLRRFFTWLLGLRGSPRAIAGGVAVGVIVAFTPTVGLQMLIAAGLATFLNLNRPAAIIPTWLTNPLTIPPVYAFTYYLGSFFWPGPELALVTRAIRGAAGELARMDFLALGEHIDAFARLGVDIFVPMWVGGLIVGGLAAGIVYPLTLRSVIELRARRQQRGRGVRRAARRRRRRRAPKRRS